MVDRAQRHYFKDIVSINSFLLAASARHFYHSIHTRTSHLHYFKAFYHSMTFIATRSLMFITNSFFNDRDATRPGQLRLHHPGAIATRAIQQLKTDRLVGGTGLNDGLSQKWQTILTLPSVLPAVCIVQN